MVIGMTIRDRLKDRRLYESRPERHKILLRDETTPETRMGAHSTQDKYAVYLDISTEYWANNAQKEQAREYAVDSLLMFLYQDVHQILAPLRSAIYSNDVKYALELLNELESKIK